jgi:hypothetical protein
MNPRKIEDMDVGYLARLDSEYFSSHLNPTKAGLMQYLLAHIEKDDCTVTRHEVREAMMYCEINHCDDPDAYTFDILNRLGIGVE